MKNRKAEILKIVILWSVTVLMVLTCVGYVYSENKKNAKGNLKNTNEHLEENIEYSCRNLLDDRIRQNINDTYYTESDKSDILIGNIQYNDGKFSARGIYYVKDPFDGRKIMCIECNFDGTYEVDNENVVNNEVINFSKMQV